MRITLNLTDDALIAARNIARRERLTLGDAVSELIRRGSPGQTAEVGEPDRPVLRGRFALLPARDEVITPQHIRDLMEP